MNYSLVGRCADDESLLMMQGDRAGICVTQLDPGLLERGLACAPGSLPCFSSAVAAVEKVRFFGGPVHSKVGLHLCA